MGKDKAISRGCFFCRSGRERELVRHFNTVFPHDLAMMPTRTRIRRTRDMAIEETTPLLPGYIFFQVSEDEPWVPGKIDPIQDKLRALSKTDGFLRLLRYTDGYWRLRGSDDLFARMLFEADGNIGISQAYFDEGNRIRITEGFLKNYEGAITSVHRKMKTVEVSIDLHGKRVSMCLGYELIEKI